MALSCSHTLNPYSPKSWGRYRFRRDIGVTRILRSSCSLSPDATLVGHQAFADKNLVLFGNPSNNLFVAPLAETSPLKLAADGAAQVEKVSGEADLTLTATTLAPLYNGFLSPSGAALAGLLTARSEEALASADAFFATLYPPFCADGF